jgi:murein DD-endopeptidase MepM/ murein hydrolase activator NlpD
MKIKLLFFTLFLMFQNTYTQNPSTKGKFHPPVDIPMELAGNFAELRSDHFHSGIDIRTQGVSGKRILSIDKGYVSRIKVQVNGYGRSVYINHPGGYTSVYGHLLSYCPKIDEYVKSYQYKNQTHTLDIYPAKNEITVERGEFIALSGNSGSSNGPHLHFEIRNSANQHPLNVLKFGFDIKDSKSPEIMGLYLYEFSGEGDRRVSERTRKLEVLGSNGNYSLGNILTIETGSPFSFGMETYDYLDANRNRCGIYTMDLIVNNDTVYSYITDEFSFAESRYLNSHIDYGYKKLHGIRIHNLFLRPNNPLSLIKSTKNYGIINPEDGKEYNIEIRLTDVYGNSSLLSFKVKVKASADMKNEVKSSEEIYVWNQDYKIEKDNFSFSLHSKSLYEDTPLSFHKSNGGTFVHPYEYNIGDQEIPLHRSGTLMIKTGEVEMAFKEKLYVSRKDEDGNWEYAGGKLSPKGWIKTDVREFGIYSLMADTIPPEIKPLNISKDANLSSSRNIRFKIRDEGSGIDDYRGFIDNEWVLFEFDKKNDLLVYTFDKKRLNSGQTHELELYISDKTGNSTLYHQQFFW